MRLIRLQVIRPFLPVAVFFLISLHLAAQPAEWAERFERREEMIPMRDGIRLRTTLYIPKNAPEQLPILLWRSPYGIGSAPFETFAWLAGSMLKELVEEGYIFAFQDIRGKFGSEGTFVMLRQPREASVSKAFDESTDTFDTINWLLPNVPGNNGRVGMFGISYDGWLTVMGMLDPHPALKAVSPQASPADMWMGDDFFHNGAFRLSYGFEYAGMMEASKQVDPVSVDRYDTFDWYLNLGELSNVNARYLHGKIPTWNDFVAHHTYDKFWKNQTLLSHLREVTVPTLNVAGWWDQEDFYGPLAIYSALEERDDKNLNFLVVGPWNHGGWASGDGDSLGTIPFGSATSSYFREQIQAPWFTYWLKDKGELEIPEALTFEAGSNTWRSWTAWPPQQEIKKRNLYFHADEKLSFEPPPAREDTLNDRFFSDPANPVPYRHRPIQSTYFPHGSKWDTWLVEDQRFVDDRPDVLSWETDTLVEDLTIAGEITANLYVSTTGTDSDWIVKLIDVYPESYPDDWKLAGWQLMVSNEVFRGRYRNSFEQPEPFPPNEIVPIHFSLHTQNYTFKKGHRIMVQVQSTWFPLIDRNPQTFVPNIFEAKSSDFRPAWQRVYRSGGHKSHITIPVVSP